MGLRVVVCGACVSGFVCMSGCVLGQSSTSVTARGKGSLARDHRVHEASMARRMRLGERLPDAQPVGVFVGEHWCSVRGDAVMVARRHE